MHSIYYLFSENTVNGSYWKWAVCTLFNQKCLKDEEKLQASGCKFTWSDGLIPSAAVVTVSQKQFCGDADMDGNKCNKERISSNENCKRLNCLFWQGDKGDTKNTLGTDRGVEIGGNNNTQKRKRIPNWTMKLLALEYYWNKSVSGFTKQKNISMVIRINILLIINLMNILHCLLTTHSIMDHCQQTFAFQNVWHLLFLL